MSDLTALRQYKDQPMFAHWAPDVADDRIAGATDSVRRLIEDVLALGTDPAETGVRAAVATCVQRFNDPDAAGDDPWIFTIEREDIGEVLWRVIDLAGFEADEGWLEGREW
jgi:hypothetical protein